MNLEENDEGEGEKPRMRQAPGRRKEALILTVYCISLLLPCTSTKFVPVFTFYYTRYAQ